MTHNPFQSPVEVDANHVPSDGRHDYVDRTLILFRIRPGGELPPRCVKCNTSDDLQRHEFQLSTYSYWAVLGFFFYIAPYFLVRYLTTRRATITGCLCQRHRRGRWLAPALCLATIPPCALVAYMASFLQNPELAKAIYAPTLGGSLFAVFMAIRLRKVLIAKKILPQEVWVVEAGKPFLDSLPVYDPTKPL